MFHHVLTPGTGGYAVLKFGAVAGVFGLRVALTRRGRRAEAPVPQPPPAEQSPQRTPHPRSKRKRARRRG